MKQKDFKILYEKYFQKDCPPSQRLTKKHTDCFEKIENFGIYPLKKDCWQCWQECIDGRD